MTTQSIRVPKQLRSGTAISGVLAMLVATVLLAGGSIFGKLVYREGVAPLTMLSTRFALTIVVLWGIYTILPGWRQYIRLGSRRQLWGCILVGTCNTVSMSLYFFALTEMDASLAVLIYSVAPGMVAGILALFGERFTRIILIRLVVALVGMVLLTSVGGGIAAPPLAVAMILGCALTYAIHLVFYQKLLAGTDTRTNTLYILSTMGVQFLLCFLIPGQLEQVPALTPNAWLLIGGFVIFTTILARLLMFHGVATIGGSQVALIGIAEPLLVVMLSYILLGERLAPSQWSGAIFILISLGLGAVQSQRKTAS